MSCATMCWRIRRSKFQNSTFQNFLVIPSQFSTFCPTLTATRQLKNFPINTFCRIGYPGKGQFLKLCWTWTISWLDQRTFTIYDINCDGNSETYGLCKLRSTDEGGLLLQPVGVDGLDNPDKLVKLSAFEPEEIISLAYANIALPEIDDSGFENLIKRPTIVLLNIDEAQWSQSEWEVLKSLPDYIREKAKSSFQTLSWRPGKRL